VRTSRALYDPTAELDACGIGFVADAGGRPSRAIVDALLEGLRRMRHRGATAADRRTGDGAGILIQVPHEFFHREGDDLYYELPVDFPTLALGGTVPAPTLNGHQDVAIPAGTQSGQRFRLRGKGMPNVAGRGAGDLYVIVRANVPRKLTKEQKHLLEQLGGTMRGAAHAPTGSSAAQDRPFFDRVKDIFG